MSYLILSEIGKFQKLCILIVLCLSMISCGEPRLVVELKDIEVREDNLIYYQDQIFTGKVKKSMMKIHGDFIEFEVKDGKLDGRVKQYSFDIDTLASDYSYKEGKLEGKSYDYWQLDDKLMREIDIQEGKGTLKEYFPDGKLMGEGTFENHKLEGRRYVYY